MADQAGPSNAAPVPQDPALLAEADAKFEEGVKCIKVGHGGGPRLTSWPVFAPAAAHMSKLRKKKAASPPWLQVKQGCGARAATKYSPHATTVSFVPGRRRVPWSRLCSSSLRCSR